MSQPDIVDAELVEEEPTEVTEDGHLHHGTDLAPVEQQQTGAAVNLFATDDPEAVIEKASAHAKALNRVVRDQGLISNIQGSEHIKVEGWTLLGSMLGVFPITEWTRPVVDEDGKKVGWEARVEARTRAGEVVGAAEAECLRSESNWSGRDDYALRSMAQTRATSKALRMPLGFVVQLAGYNPTPAEEMPGSWPHEPAGPQSVPDKKRAVGATDKQRNYIKVLQQEHEIPDDEYRMILKSRGVESSRDEALTKDKASGLIEALQDDAKREALREWARQKLAARTEGGDV